MRIIVYIFMSFFLVGGFGLSPTYAAKTNNDEYPFDFQIEMLRWEEVIEFLPRYSKFTVIDVETGKSFRVQRRAGQYHADVQPLTRKDTKTMKEIYNVIGAGEEGRYSFKQTTN